MCFRNCRQLSVFHNLPETLLFLLCFCAAGLGFLISLGDRAFALDSDENSAVIRISRNGASTDDSSLEMTGQIERYEVDPENKDLCSVDGVLYSKDRKTLVLFPKKYPAKEFEIPSGVTKIEERAFAGSCELESVVVPGSVEIIENRAFASCRSLRSVVLSEGVASIGTSAFEACYALTSVKLPKSLKKIGDKAFCDCSTLESIFIPEGVNLIGTSAFFRCYSMNKFEVAEENGRYRSIDGVLFSKDGKTLIDYPIHSDRKVYEIPKGVETVGEHAFWHCTSLEFVFLPEGVKRIDSSGFCYCLSLKTVYFPETVEVIGDFAFAMCPSLKAVSVPKTVKTIAPYAFQNCSSLKTVELSENVKRINKNAFASCDSLTIVAPKGSYAEEFAKENGVSFEPLVIPWTVVSEVFISKDVEELGEELVANVYGPNVKQIDVDPENPNFSSVDGVLYSKDGKALIKVPEDRHIQEFVIPSGVTHIGDMCFNGCYIQTITIPASVEKISPFAFGCVPTLWKFNVADDSPYFKSVDGVLFSKDGKTLVSYPYDNPRSAYVAPDGVTSVGDRAFTSCVSLNTVSLPEGVETIGKGAFDCCYSLTTVALPQSLKKIDDGAFARCLGLRELRVPDGVTEIGTDVVIGFDSNEFPGLPRLGGKTTIRASKVSYAEEYAKKNELRFRPL